MQGHALIKIYVRLDGVGRRTCKGNNNFKEVKLVCGLEPDKTMWLVHTRIHNSRLSFQQLDLYYFKWQLYLHLICLIID